MLPITFADAPLFKVLWGCGLLQLYLLCDNPRAQACRFWELCSSRPPSANGWPWDRDRRGDPLSTDPLRPSLETLRSPLKS